MTTPITASVWVDGARLNDGCGPPPPPLVVVGPPARTNQAINPGYEVGTGCYLTNNGTNYPITADTTAPIAGTRSAVTTRAGTMNPTVASTLYTTAPGVKIPVTGGQQLTGAVSVKTDVDDCAVTSRIYWYDADNVVTTGPVTTRVAATVAGQVYRIVETGTAPVNAVTAYLGLVITRNGGVNTVPGQRFWADQLTIEDGTTDGSYFDGDTPATADLQYAWTGTPNGSTSTVSPLTYVAQPDTEPVALSGLKVIWGRQTTVDQIEPSTCSFQILDPPGGGSFLDLLYVGAAIRVRAAGDVPAPPVLPINADPSFESATPGSPPPTWSVSSGTATVDRSASHTGAQSVRLDAAATGGTVTAAIPPAATSSDPAAWDDLPKYRAGESWVLSAWVILPPSTAAQITLGAALYATPSSGPTLLTDRVTVTGSAAARWQQITLTVGPGSAGIGAADGMWLGMVITAASLPWSVLPGSWANTAGAWVDYSRCWVDDVQLLPPQTAGAVHRDVVVFDGRITDLTTGWDPSTESVVCAVDAVDFTADLANRDVSAAPWPAEPLSTRFGHILTGGGVTVPHTIAPTLAGYQISWRDVDSVQVWPLLKDLATSVDGVLWSATHDTTGPYLLLADPRTQAALYQLVEDGGVVYIRPTPAGSDAIDVDACDVLRDPVVFHQSASDVITRAAVSWLQQDVDDTGQPAPTQQTELLIDAAAEVRLGSRRIEVTTELTTAADADQVAQQLLARLRLQSWRLDGIVWQTDTSTPMDGGQIARCLDLLDGTRRIGAAIRLTNLPDWTPTGADSLPLLLQGGGYSYENGAWVLDLATSSAAAQGASAAWNELDPAWSWNMFDPTITWTDLIGVGP